MNTLQIIKDRIDRQQRQHEARLSQIKYRGLDYSVNHEAEDHHGNFCYRGKTYIKWTNNKMGTDIGPFFVSINTEESDLYYEASVSEKQR